MSISYGNNIPLSPSLSSPLCSLSLFFGVHLWFMPARFDFCSVCLLQVWVQEACYSASCLFVENLIWLSQCLKYPEWKAWETAENTGNSFCYLHLDYGSELTLLSCLFCFRMNLISWRTQKLHAAKLPCLYSRCVCWLPKLSLLTSGSWGSVAPLTRFRSQQWILLVCKGNPGNKCWSKTEIWLYHLFPYKY